MSERPMHQGDNFAKLLAIYQEGEAMIEAGDLEGAVRKFTEGLAIDDHFRQRYVTMYAQRAFALQKLRRFEEAVADYTKALELEAELNHAQYFFHRGMCHERIDGHAALADADYSRSIELFQGHPGPFHLRGRLYANVLGKHREAIQDFDRLLEMNPVPEGFQLRGYCKMMIGDHAGALPDVREAKRLAPDPYDDYLEACCLAVMGDEPAMLDAVRRAMAADPEYARSFQEDAEFEPYRATESFQRAVARPPN